MANSNTEGVLQKTLNRGLNTSKNFFSLQEGQSPACINVEFNKDNSFSKRLGTSTMNTIALESTGGYGMFDLGILGYGGIDANCQLMLHCNGVDESKTFTDSSVRNYTVTTGLNAQIDTAQSKLGGASGLFPVPEDSDTKLYSSFDGADAGTSYTDPVAGAYTFVGTARLDEGQKKFGTTSLFLDGDSDYVTQPASVNWNFGTGDFTIDFWVRFNSITGQQILVAQQLDATNLWYFGKTSDHKLFFQTFISDVSKGDYVMTSAWSGIAINTWYHLTVVRTTTTCQIFIDGVSQTLTENTAFGVNNIGSSGTLYIGRNGLSNNSYVNGWIDEFRVSKGIARWSANFTPPTYSYGAGYLTVTDNVDWNFGLGDFTIDTWVNFISVLTSQAFIGQGSNSNNYWVWQYQSSPNSLVFKNYSGGSLLTNVSGVWSPTTSTWYHLAVARQTTNNWYMFVDGTSLAVGGTVGGAISDLVSLLKIGINTVTTDNTNFSGYLDEFRVSKGAARWTANFTRPSSEYFSDITQERRLLCASGTGLYFSQDIGKTWAICQTNRTAAINYFSFVKDYVINTNESYNIPQYWTGSNNVYFANISTATPACKHSLASQGFLILLNESANKTGFYYVDQNNMFTSAFDNFKLPTDRNDELTGGFSLGRILYISSKYKLFRLLYTTGNPDWIYNEIKSFGFVPKTMKKINISGIGEIVIGMDWSKKIRIFDGSNDEVISDIISDDNGITPFYLNNINDLNLNKCWAEDDKKNQIYRLYLVYGGSSTISYAINFNYRSGALYPENNRPFQSGVLAKDTADASYMLACDYNGRIHQLNSGNTDNVTAIDEYFTSSLFYNQSPARILKMQQLDLLFSTTSSGTIYLEDRNQYSNLWNLNKTFTLGNAVSSIQIRQTANIPTDINIYQFKLSSSANTAVPWVCNSVILSPLASGVGEP